jgi:phage gp36-like protein
VYATVADLVLRYSEREIRQRTDRDNSGEIDAAVAGQALDKATAIIDTRLRSRYALPLSPVPREIQDLCERLARWKLFDDNPPEHIVSDAKLALAELDKYATGLLVLDAAPATGDVVPAEASFEAEPRRFTRHSLRGL